MKPDPLNYRELFEKSPASFLILDKNFTILTATDKYLRETMTSREEISGRNIFEVFPDNPGDKTANGMHNLNHSLNLVLQNREPHSMAVQKYDIKMPDGEFTVRY